VDQERLFSWATALALTVAAFIVRFYRISEPDQVVFDEVHFGAFAGQYIRREYYFDVHPPLAKMMNAAAAWFVGFKGDFGFDSIGDSYTLNNVSIAAESPTGSKLMYRCPMLA
jgi:dolichyl-phosphate-mannose-protein mannosyltransferase